MSEEKTIFRFWCFYPAHGPAVDTGRSHPNKKATIKANIMGKQGAIPYIGIEKVHGETSDSANYATKEDSVLAVFGPRNF
jgi:hypothetical protein